MLYNQKWDGESKKVKGRNKFIKFYFIILYSIFLLSCKGMFNEPVKEYFEYCSETCQIGRIDFSSENTTIDNIVNLSAKEDIQIDVFVINPKQFDLLKKTGGNCFSLQNQEGTLSYSNYTETLVDKNYIKIKATLTDESEG